MAELFRMPAVAADAATAVLSAWQVAEGASFTKDDALVSIETPAAHPGLAARRRAAAGHRARRRRHRRVLHHR
ncbi:hypothetical protein AB0Q93_11485, partial [Streptomyces sp. NPDC088184]